MRGPFDNLDGELWAREVTALQERLEDVQDRKRPLEERLRQLREELAAIECEEEEIRADARRAKISLN